MAVDRPGVRDAAEWLRLPAPGRHDRAGLGTAGSLRATPHYFLAQGALVYANGIVSDSLVIDARGESVAASVGPYVPGPRRLAGFWILEAPDAETAREWAIEASGACNEPVELRAFH